MAGNWDFMCIFALLNISARERNETTADIL